MTIAQRPPLNMGAAGRIAVAIIAVVAGLESQLNITFSSVSGALH